MDQGGSSREGLGVALDIMEQQHCKYIRIFIVYVDCVQLDSSGIM